MEKLISVLVVIAILLVWYLVTKFGNVNPHLIPSPGKVWDAALDIMKEGYKDISLIEHLGVSLRRLAVAFVLAAVIAVPLGLASGYSSKIRAIASPIVEFIRPLPPLAYYTLIILWMGIDDSSKVALLLIAAFAPIYIACMSAMQTVRRGYIDCARTMGASKWQIFILVSFPACLPQMFIGLRTAVGVAYTTLVAAEMVAAVKGIGWMVLDASRFLRSDVIFVGIFIMGFTGILLDQIVRIIGDKVVFWKGFD
jgi:taurine transport system permease protein